MLKAFAVSIAAAALCLWVAFCLLFWQGSWQLLYHPSSAVTRTPASAGLAFDGVAFAANENGQPRLKGWWIAADANASLSRLTVLYLHGENGDLSDTVDALATLHGLGVNVLAFDYRGYGQSEFARPGEAHWREDAESAFRYLTGTRGVAANAIVVEGEGLGANLALEVAAAHPELAGVILSDPVPDAVNVIFSDARAKLVPARLLVRDRYEMDGPAAALRVPSLWMQSSASAADREPEAYGRITARKMLVWLSPQKNAEQKQSVDAISRWLAELPNKSK